ncbi:MAG: hypothetical protein JWP44_2633 [Mucilaginibacter sp.]|nr:hypothetical protein [Mucilaginibacter sp.]
MEERLKLISLQSALDELRRVSQFENNWLKHNHPDIYKDMKEASGVNDGNYNTYLMKRMSKRFEDLRLIKKELSKKH